MCCITVNSHDAMYHQLVLLVLLFSQPALKRKQTKKSITTAAFTATAARQGVSPPPAQPETQPGDDNVWCHETPSDDDVFLPPKKKSQPIPSDDTEDDDSASGSSTPVKTQQTKQSVGKKPPTSISPKPATSNATPSNTPRRRSSAFSGSPSQTESMVRGPKKSSEILCWLEPEFQRRGVPRAYRYLCI